MFTVCFNVSLSSGKAGVRSCIASVNNQRRTFRHVVDSCRENAALNNTSYRAQCPADSSTSRILARCLPNLQVRTVRDCSSDVAPKRENVFGDLCERQFTKVEMDEDEKIEEEFVESEARVLSRHRLTPGGYANLIKAHVQRGDLKSALEVLDLVAENRDKPTIYMYNLLLRAFAVVGDFKKSRMLYTKMKKLGLKCNSATYTSIINACANYHHTETALEYLGDLRQEFAEKNVVLNETHYNAMIKAYGRHGAIQEAFSLADHMRDQRLPTNLITFNSLLIGAISNPKAGLRHSLVIWHMMRRHAIRPSVLTYNLLLRAIRDTKLGNLRLDDILISAPPTVQISLNDTARPDLLQRQPTVSSLVYTEIAAKPSNPSDEATTEANGPFNLPANIDSNAGEKSLVDARQALAQTSLETIRNKNRLILFGGPRSILEHMDKDEATPDTKTMTLLMELVPQTDKCEREILGIAKDRKIPLDVDFFNMLMKKRSLRRDYDSAKAILDDIQRNGLCPDVITWGILALGCQTLDDARDLMDGMKATGHRLNTVVAGTLINIACKKMRFAYVLEIMEKMLKYRLKPNWELYCTLDAFHKEINEMMRNKKNARTVNHPGFQAGFAKFNLRYPTWQKEMERKEVKNSENKYKRYNPRR